MKLFIYLEIFPIFHSSLLARNQRPQISNQSEQETNQIFIPLHAFQSEQKTNQIQSG